MIVSLGNWVMWVSIYFHATFDVRCWLEVSRKIEEDLGLGLALFSSQLDN